MASVDDRVPTDDNVDDDDVPPPSGTTARPRGPLAWMARNAVASNLLMFGLILGGLIFLSKVKQEVFPAFQLDVIHVAVPYPGASPEEVERAIIKVVEENIRGIDGVKTVTATAAEGAGAVNVELELDAERDRVLNDVKASVDRITSFPADAERPIVSLLEFKNPVITLVLYGEGSEKALRALADKTRDELLNIEGISQAELDAVRAPEISIEVPRAKLEAYNLSLDQVAAAVRAANVELPAGGIKTDRGEVLLRTSERRDYGTEFDQIVVLSRPDGTEVKLGDLATINDDFVDSDQNAFFNGKPAAMVTVYRVGDQTPVEVVNLVREYVDDHAGDLPPGVSYAFWNDRSEMYRDRVDLLMRNALVGLALVLFVLGLFLEIRLAFWVTMGIPISFIGAALFLPGWDVSINMISLFAFIVTLGIVVDDAIVVGEAVYKRMQDGLSMAQAAVQGAKDVGTPVIFSVLTTVVAFSPLLFVPGTMGKFFRNIPTVVITVLLLSLVESLLVLPAHLGHRGVMSGLMAVVAITLWAFGVPIVAAAVGAALLSWVLVKLVGAIRNGFFDGGLGPAAIIYNGQRKFSHGFERFVERRFVPLVGLATRNRYLTLATSVALLVATMGFVASGRMDFTFLTKIESDIVVAQLEMPYGTPASVTQAHTDRIAAALEETMAEYGGREAVTRGTFSQIGLHNRAGTAGPDGGGHSGGSHLSEVAILLKTSDQRSFRTAALAETWRKKVGEVAGASALKFSFTTGASNQAPISIRVSHPDVATLEAAAEALSTRLADYSGVRDIDDGVALGKRQLDIELTPAARSLGIDETTLARQVRAAFFGAEASRQQRGRDEVRTYVRLPREERTSLHDLDQLRIRTPQGGEIPLRMAAHLTWGRAYTSITREDGHRVLNVEADVDDTVTNENKVMSAVAQEVYPDLKEQFPGITFGLAGQQKSRAESLAALGDGFVLALILMYALMAIPFRSYLQPLIIMVAIPFGLVGAIGGHLLMGYDLSILSMMGFVALSGVVVNDSLVLISAVNDYKAGGMPIQKAVVAGAARRFRPILLTSLTTFFGLAPMIVETSVQARFLIPMALSLGFGVIFSTFIILLLVPALYLILEDLQGLFGGSARRGGLPAAADQALPSPAE
ncbi:MAG: efflux RND transporter permease subunit [Myxococcota bacterium]